ncbi:MAG: flagellar biosynthesis protein FlhF [Dissulfuribacterales bacterium]
MKVKHFRGNNISKVMLEVKKELGQEAVILETRQLPGQGGSLVEIVAAIDYPDDHFVPGLGVNRYSNSLAAANINCRASAGQPAGFFASAGYRELHQEVVLMKKMLNRLLETTGFPGEWDASGVLADLYQQLLVKGIHEEACRSLLDRVVAQLPAEKPASREMVIGCLAQQIIDDVPLLKVDQIGRLVTLVGPTGVGKTTTVAKLAAFFSRDRNEEIGLISVDTFRLGATAQIREYARRLEVPVRVVKSHAAMEQALEEFSSMDRVIIDTMGRSHHDEKGLQALQQILPANQEMTSLLVVPAGIQEDDLLDVLVQFRRFAYGALLFSKLDETTCHGILLRGCQLARLPLSFFTTGQLVPEDMEEASGERVASLLLDLH